MVDNIERDEEEGEIPVASFVEIVLLLARNLEKLSLCGNRFLPLHFTIPEILRSDRSLLTRLMELSVTSGRVFRTFSFASLDTVISLLISAPNLVDLHLEIESTQSPQLSSRDKKKITLEN